MSTPAANSQLPATPKFKQPGLMRVVGRWKLEVSGSWKLVVGTGSKADSESEISLPFGSGTIEGTNDRELEWKTTRIHPDAAADAADSGGPFTLREVQARRLCS